MAFDAIFMGAVLEEIRERALSSRVEKIHQPGRDSLLLLLRCREGREKLLFTPNPAAPRLHFTGLNPENPPEPPMFCMLLRKHLLGARLADIRQPLGERCAQFVFDTTDELGDPVQKTLVAELMGRTCNLYLLGPDGRILDCLRRIGLDESARPALPGLLYQPPAPVTKADPRQADFRRLLAAPGADLVCDRLMDTLAGLSPLVCREAALAACGDMDARVSALDPEAAAAGLEAFFVRYVNHPEPWLHRAPDGTPKQFAFCPLTQYGGGERQGGFSALLDGFYSQRDRRDALRQRSQTLRKSVTNLLQRVRRKLAIQEKELAATLDRERTRQLGDIVTANLHRIARGQRVLEAEDFYDEDMQVIKIPLNVTLSPQQNAAKFYKDYTRMKNAQRELTHQLDLGRTEEQYLCSVLEELERAGSDQELEAIRRELQEGGYLRAEGKKRLKAKTLPPLRFESTDGYPIYVGRNNGQNDELTFRLARKDDLWLHAQKVHGSHVIISCGGTKPPDDTVTQAAQLAAHYSGAAGGQNLPVDVTPVRQVKKLPGAKPGMVIYHTYRTIYVNPYADIVVDALNAENRDG